MDWENLLELAHPWIDLAGSALGALAVVALAQLACRLIAGATPWELVRSGFRECPPLHAGMKCLSDAMLIALIGAFTMLGRAAYVVYRLQQDGKGWSIDWLLRGGLAAGTLLGFIFLVRAFRTWRSNLRVEGTPVQVHVEAVTEGISPADLKNLGAEAFPNRVGDGWRMGLVVRHLILWMLIASLGGWASIWIWDLAGFHDHPNLRRLPVPTTGSVLMFMSSLCEAVIGRIGDRPTWLPAAAYLAVASFLVFLPSNRSYLLLRAPAHAIILGASGVGSVLAALHLGGATWGIGVSIGAKTLLAWRCGSDLSRERQNCKRQSFLEPIRRETVATCPWLSRIPSEMAANYPKLDLRELASRVSQGMLNVEESTTWVTRNFGRLVRRPEVAHRRCASAILRYLTVNRSAGFARSWSTRAPLRYPKVPVWDLIRFPLNPPPGFVSADDRLELGSEWNAVCTCNPCGGSGTVMVEETYQETETRYETVYNNGQSQQVSRTVTVTKTRMVQRTCSGCGGTGRLEHVQCIDTSWRTMGCSVVTPHLPVPELAEGAGETVFFRQPFIEDRQVADLASPHSAAPGKLTREMNESGRAMANLSDRVAPSVLEQTNGAYVYRSDFIVVGFHLIRIRFGRWLRWTGWFFGQRPEFFFPRLPLSGSAVATQILGLPARAYVAFMTATGVARFVNLFWQ